jgi:hypothetical protein
MNKSKFMIGVLSSIIIIPILCIGILILYIFFYPQHKQYSFRDSNNNSTVEIRLNRTDLFLTYLIDDWEAKYYHATPPINTENMYEFSLKIFQGTDTTGEVINELRVKNIIYKFNNEIIYPDEIVRSGGSAIDGDINGRFNYDESKPINHDLMKQHLSLLFNKQKLENIDHLSFDLIYVLNGKEIVYHKLLKKNYEWKSLSDEI